MRTPIVNGIDHAADIGELARRSVRHDTFRSTRPDLVEPANYHISIMHIAASPANAKCLIIAQIPSALSDACRRCIPDSLTREPGLCNNRQPGKCSCSACWSWWCCSGSAPVSRRLCKRADRPNPGLGRLPAADRAGDPVRIVPDQAGLSMMPALSIRDLKKTYKGGHVALKGVSFDVARAIFSHCWGRTVPGRPR